MKRLAADTFRGLAVTALVALLRGSGAAGEDAPVDAVDDLRAALRTTAPVEQRVAALERAAKAPRIGDTDTALRAAVDLGSSDRRAKAAAFEVALRALEEAPPSEDVLDDVRARAAEALVPDLLGGHALELLLGDRRFPPSRAAAAADPELGQQTARAIRFDAPEMGAVSIEDAATWPTKEAWERHARVAGLLDAALRDDAGTDGKKPTPMQQLVAAKEDALPYLLAVATPRESGTPPGLVPRRVRAIVALGLIGDRRATPVLVKGLDDKNGWVRVAAANAVGDLGDPSAVAPLCRILFYLGDLHRPFDSWDYPGRSNVDISEEDWQSVEYYSIDQAAADALLRLGVRNAGGWLIDERLDPRRGNWRIRVPQDAVDALRRSFGKLPVEYVPDGSVPSRIAAWHALRAWWKTRPAPANVLDENDPGYRAGLAPVIAALTGSSVMEQQIAGNCVELLGSAAAPAVLEALEKATKRPHRAALAFALGRTHDPRVVPALVKLAGDPGGAAVRAAAIAALGSYVRGPAATKEALDAVLARTAEAEQGPRAAAFEALANAPLDPRVLEAAKKARGDGPPGPDDAASVRVALLVQTGEGLDEVLALLRSPELWRRRQAWELLRRALDLAPDLFDPVPDPPAGRPIDRAAVEEALRARRAAK
jgi:HEAT repeat protein